MVNLVEVFVGVPIKSNQIVFCQELALNLNKQAAIMKCIELPHFFHCGGGGRKGTADRC